MFEKLQENPVIAEPPEDSARHFRDPKVWKHRDVWYMVIGNSSKENVGRVVLYRSPDLRDWEYAGFSPKVTVISAICGNVLISLN